MSQSVKIYTVNNPIFHFHHTIKLAFRIQNKRFKQFFIVTDNFSENCDLFLGVEFKKIYKATINFDSQYIDFLKDENHEKSDMDLENEQKLDQSQNKVKNKHSLTVKQTDEELMNTSVQFSDKLIKMNEQYTKLPKRTQKENRVNIEVPKN